MLVRSLAPALVFATTLPGCQARGTRSAPGDEEAILALLREQEAAWNRGDLEGFLRGYLDSDETTFFSGSTVTSGFAEVRERYRSRYQGEGREMGRLSFQDLRVDLLGPSGAVARGRWRLQTQSGEPGGLFTLTLWKLREGWRIVHDHTSS